MNYKSFFIPLVLVILFSNIAHSHYHGEQAYPSSPHHAIHRRDLVDTVVDTVNSKVDRLIASLVTPVVCANSSYRIDPVAFPYRPPGPTDKRGPCPGLNALANHGYLPRNGIVTARQLRDASICITSLSVDVTAVLIAVVFTTAGDLVADQLSLGEAVSGGIIQTNQGLNFHAGIESDTSMSRSDFYFGDNHSFNLTLWNQMKNLAESRPDKWSLRFFSDLRYLRYQQSKAANPTLVYTPFQYIITAATASIAHDIFADLNQEPTTATESTWFVNERIPDNLQLRPDALSLQDGLDNAFEFFKEHPVDLTGSSHLPFPTRKECMRCFLRALFQENLPLANANAINFVYSTFLTPYCQCSVPDCGY